MGGGGGGRMMFSGLDIFFRLRRDPVLLFANNTKRQYSRILLDLDIYFFSGKSGFGFFFRKIFLPP